MIELTDPAAHKWRQGTVVPRDLRGLKKACEFRVEKPLQEDDVLIIATQDCDLCASTAEEPEVEVVVARPDAEDNNLRYGKSARRLQVDLNIGGNLRTFTIHVRERGYFPKAVFAGAGAAAAYDRLAAGDLKLFRRWLGRRYSRTALPSEFNRRCSSAAQKLRTKLKNRAATIRRICVQITSYEELPANDAYGLSVFLIVTSESVPGSAAFQEALGAQSVVEAAFASCEGIELHNVAVASEAELTVQEAELMTAWEYADTISYSQGTADQLLDEL